MAPTNEAANSVRMVTRAGELVDVPASQAANLFKTGQAGFVKDSTVALRDSSGALKNVSGAEAANALLGGGANMFSTIGTQQELAKQVEAAKYGGALAQAGALGTGVANSLLLGAGDTVISKGLGLLSDSAAEGYLDFARKSEQYNKGLRTAGEVAGFLVPAALSGGAAGVARGAVGAASGVARGAAALGGAAERAIVGGLAKEGAATLGARALGSLGGAAVEGALYGAGGAINEATLKGDEITAQKILAGAGGGALLGGATGGLLTLGGGAVAKAISKKGDDVAAGLMSTAATKTDDAAGALKTNFTATAETKAAGEAANAELKASIAESNLAAKIEGNVAKKADDLAAAVEGNISKGNEASTLEKYLDKFATTKELKSTGATPTKIADAFERGEGFAAGVARQVREDLPALAGKDSFITIAPREMSELAAQNLKNKGTKIESILNSADEVVAAIEKNEGRRAFVDIAPYLPGVTKELRAELMPQLEGRLGGLKTAKKLNDVLDDIDRLAGSEFTFKGAQKIRANLDDEIRWSGAAAGSDIDRALKVVSNRLENEIFTSLEKVGAKQSAETALEYAGAKNAWAQAKWLADATERGAAREAAPAIGFGDKIAGIGGALVGGVSAGPLGAATGALSAVGSSLMKQYGDQVSSTIARKIIANDTLRGLISSGENRATNAINALLPMTEGASSRAVAGKAAALTSEITSTVSKPPPRANVAREYDSLRQQVTSFSPAQMTRSLAAVAEANPELAAKLDRQAAAANAWLRSKLPIERNQNALIAPNPNLSTATPSEKQAFVDAAKVVNDPNSVFDDMMNGTLNRAKVEALKNVYPQLYDDLKTKTTDRLIDLKEKGVDVPYNKRLQLGILLEVPTDPTLTPDFIKNSQNYYASGISSIKQTAAPGAPLKLSVTYSTPVQKVEG